MKKIIEDIIILHKCTKNHDHICYTVLEIWSMTDVIVAYEIVALTPPSSSKNQNFKKMKTKCLQISSFYVCVT